MHNKWKKYRKIKISVDIFGLIWYYIKVAWDKRQKIKYMRKCRNWQTSKTKDLVIIAIVWVQVPSSALNNKTGIKQNVWSLSCCSKPKRALNPWFKVSPPARSARGMRSPGPHSPHLPLCFGRRRADIPQMSCGLRSASVVAEQTSPGCLATHIPHGFGCGKAGAHLPR